MWSEHERPCPGSPGGIIRPTVATALSFSTAALSTRAVGTEATSWAVWTSARRLILAVTGSSADTRRVPVRLRGFHAIAGLQFLDPTSQLGDGRGSLLRLRPGQSGLELAA